LVTLSLISGCVKPPEEEVAKRVQAREFERPVVEPPPILPPPLPGFVSFDSFEDTLVIDAQTLSSQDALNAFYLIGCDRFNINEELSEFRRGVDKGINSLSTERFIKPTVQIGNSGCIFRIDQSDYDISDSELEMIARRNPFNVISETTRGDTIKFYLQKETTWAFADAFFLTAFEGDVITAFNGDTYRNIIEQPRLDVDFFANEGINVQDEFNFERARAGGTNDSPIAFGSRLFYHVEAENGWMHVSHDSSLAVPDSINENPFLIEIALAQNPDYSTNELRTPKLFTFQARETLYTLPNGLTGVRLSDNGGLAVGAAPADVVVDNRSDIAGLEPVIRLAACLDCHAKGSIGYTDELREHVGRRSNFNEEEKLLASIFFNDTNNQQAFRETDENLARALAQLNIDSLARDPLNARLVTPSRKPYDVRKASAKFFLTPGQYQDCLRGGNIIAQNLGAHLTGDRTTLQVLADNFQQVIIECNLFKDLEL
jgi:hypothetical protein